MRPQNVAEVSPKILPALEKEEEGTQVAKRDPAYFAATLSVSPCVMPEILQREPALSWKKYELSTGKQ
jgi:hypothetical protein